MQSELVDETSADASRENPSFVKERCNWAHAAARAWERYQIPAWLFAQIGEAIQASVACKLPMFDVVELRKDDTFKNRSMFAVHVERRWIPVTFDFSTNSPVTTLPQKALEAYQVHLDRRTPVVEEPVQTFTDAPTLLKEIYEASQVELGKKFAAKQPRLMEALTAVKKFFEGEAS